VSYVFYDTETSGLSPEFDQILQFAAIRTDNDFNEIERFEIRSRLLPHIVPSPKALQVTGITPELLTDASLPSHYQMTCQIRDKLVEWSPSIFLGYNTLSFDENFLRQSLFQTLHSPYITNTQGNLRADVLRLVQAAIAYAPECLIIPISDKGKPVLKLDQLAPANGFSHENAHEAMADVEATIHIAKTIREVAPEVWQNVMKNCRKSSAIEVTKTTEILTFTELYFNKEYSWLVTYCGENPDYRTQLAVFDLQYEPANFIDLDVEALVQVMNSKQKAIRTVRTNAQPILMPLELAIMGTKAKYPEPLILVNRARTIRNNIRFQDRVGQALANRFPEEEPSAYPEKRIYDGFPSLEDGAFMEQFHREKWSDRPVIANRLEDDTLREFALRLIFAEAPSQLPQVERDKMENWMRRRAFSNDDGVPWNTVRKAIRETNDLLAVASDCDKDFLYSLRSFYEGMASTEVIY
jgi:exodeoxyribonuclease I